MKNQNSGSNENVSEQDLINQAIRDSMAESAAHKGPGGAASAEEAEI